MAVAIFGSVGAAWIGVARKRALRERAMLKEHARATRAHYAAVEAGEEDPSFLPDVIQQFVIEVLRLANGFWREQRFRDVDGRPDAKLVRAWAQARQSWLGNGLEAKRKPSIDLLRVVNRGNEAEDRVDLRVRVRIHCKHPAVGLVATRWVGLDERWTLGRCDGRWALLSMGGDPLAGPVLSAPLIPNASFDTDRLREESLAELASAQKVGDDVDLSDLVDPKEPPALALLDLSILDGRFLPALIGAELARMLEAWEEAVNGSEQPLQELAGAEARAALLRPSPHTRLVIHDTVLKSWEPTNLDLSRRPPAIEVKLDVEAIRFVVTDHGDYRAGNETDTHRVALRWVLELSDSARTPWHLAVSNDPSEAIPGG